MSTVCFHVGFCICDLAISFFTRTPRPPPPKPGSAAMRGCLAFLRCPPPGSGPPSAHGAPGAGPRRPEMHLQREFPRPDGTGLAAGAGAASGGFLGCRSPLNFTVSKTTKGLGAGDLKRGRKGLRPRPRRLSSPRRASSCGTGGSPRSAPSPRGLREAGGGVRGGAGRERGHVFI